MFHLAVHLKRKEGNVIGLLSQWFRMATGLARGPRGPTAAVVQPPRNSKQIAYLVSVFPSLTETFVLYEMLGMRNTGTDVTLYSLQRARPKLMQREAAAILPQVKFQPFLSWQVLCAQVYFLRRAPRAYLAAWWTWLRATWGSLRYFTGAIVFFPKTVCFARMMQEAEITHVHAHFASHPAAAALVIHRLTGIPYSFTAHGSDLHRESRMLREKVAEAAFVVSISEFNKDWIARVCGETARKKVAVVRCGVDRSVFCPPLEDRRRPNAEAAIFCIGTLYEVKGQKYLLEACALLRDRGVPFTCHFVGDGPDRKMLGRLAQAAGLEDHVRFHGRLPRDEIVALLQQADVLVTPSVVSRDGRREGLPTVLLEGMAAEVPVVASRLSGIPEVVEHERTGLLFPPGDSRALADELERLIAAPAMGRQLVRAGRQKVEDEYDRVKNCARLARYIADGYVNDDEDPSAAMIALGTDLTGRT